MYVKLLIYVPKKQKDNVLKRLSELGAGRFGNYDSYSFVREGVTTFRPLNHANPSLGKKNKKVTVKEVCIETICQENEFALILQELRKIHPYEEPAFCVYKILDLSLV